MMTSSPGLYATRGNGSVGRLTFGSTMRQIVLSGPDGLQTTLSAAAAGIDATTRNPVATQAIMLGFMARFCARGLTGRLHGGRDDGGGFDLDDSLVFEQRADLDDRHRGEPAAHHLAVSGADLELGGEIRAFVGDEPRHPRDVFGSGAGLRENRDDVAERLTDLVRDAGRRDAA